MKWTNRGKEFDGLAELICNRETKYYIWGAGVFGKTFYDRFNQMIVIDGFIDSDTKKQGNDYKNKMIYEPDFINDKLNKIVILISAGWTKEIFSELDKRGYKKNIDYIHIDEFASVYMMYRYDKLYLSDVTYMITEKCSLKCKNCNAFIPMIKDPKHVDINSIIESFEIFFKWVDKVNVLGLVGGDAMMHPDFYQVVDSIASRYYSDRIENIEIYSNAVIVPDEKIISLFKKYDMFYRFTDYRPYTERKQKIEQVVELLENNKIKYDHVKFVKWCDSGYPQQSNGIIGDENLVHFYDNCDRRTCHGLVQGKVINCSMGYGAELIGYNELMQSDYFDLKIFNFERKKELMEYMLGYSEKGYLSYCKKCNGGLNVNNNFIEAGEQL